MVKREEKERQNNYFRRNKDFFRKQKITFFKNSIYFRRVLREQCIQKQKQGAIFLKMFREQQ